MPKETAPKSTRNATKGTPALIMHRAARIEDWLHSTREGFARKRGYVPTVVPYAGYGSTEWVRILCRVLLAKPPRPKRKGGNRRWHSERRDGNIRGWRSFTSVPVNDVTVTIEINGQSHRVQADRGGVVDTVVRVALAPGKQIAVLHTDAGAPVEAPLFIVSPSVTHGILSDIDDTVMVTTLPRPLLAAWNTFVLDEHARVPTPGMAVLLDRLAAAAKGAPMVYLSTGAWNVAPTLTRFLSRNLYPPGALLLTDWGPTHDRWFRSGQDHKRENLRRLAQEFPDIRWILIGDDGQHDEAIYGQFERDFPTSVEAVAIRQLSPSEAVLAGRRARAAALAPRNPAWVYGPDGASLARQLAEKGLL